VKEVETDGPLPEEDKATLHEEEESYYYGETSLFVFYRSQFPRK
jgi:hypothetical protein